MGTRNMMPSPNSLNHLQSFYLFYFYVFHLYCIFKKMKIIVPSSYKHTLTFVFILHLFHKDNLTFFFRISQIIGHFPCWKYNWSLNFLICVVNIVVFTNNFYILAALVIYKYEALILNKIQKKKSLVSPLFSFFLSSL